MTIKTQQMLIEDISIDVARKKVKYLRICIHSSTGRVSISAPHRIDIETVRGFAVSRLGWIRKHLAKISKQEREAPLEYVTHEKHFFKGRGYLLNVINHNAAPKVEIRDDVYIDLYVRESCKPKQRKAIMSSWYREQLKASIPPVIVKWQAIIGVEIKEWGVKQMKTRWGTCSIRARRIWINLEFAKKPEYCLEYIVVHEMLHLLELKHNDRFYGYMDRFLPKWRDYKEEMNRQGQLLQG